MATNYGVAVAFVVLGANDGDFPGPINTGLFGTDPNDVGDGYHKVYDNQLNIIDFHYVTISNPSTFYRIEKSYKLKYPLPINMAHDNEVWMVVHIDGGVCPPNEPYQPHKKGSRRSYRPKTCPPLRQEFKKAEQKGAAIGHIRGILSYNNKEGISNWINGNMDKIYNLS